MSTDNNPTDDVEFGDSQTAKEHSDDKVQVEVSQLMRGEYYAAQRSDDPERFNVCHAHNHRRISPNEVHTDAVLLADNLPEEVAYFIIDALVAHTKRLGGSVEPEVS